MNVALVVEIIIGGRDSQPLLAVEKIELFALSGKGNAKTWVQALDPVTSPDARTKEPPAETFTN